MNIYSRQNPPEGFYVYAYLREDGTPYYVGKGCGDRAFTSHNHTVACPIEVFRILTQEYESEDEAFMAEKFLISFYGRRDLGTGCLRNLTEGGEGLAGLVRTEDHSRKISEAKKGIVPKWANPKGYVRTEAHRQQIRNRMIGTALATGTTFNRGRKQSPELRKLRYDIFMKQTPEQRSARAKHAAMLRWGKALIC